MSARLISIIGPPAVGKTTLAQLLAQKLGAKVLYEDWQGNPHLSGSYDGSPHLRLPGQLCFLRSRAAQLDRSRWPSEGIFVSDYGFCQDRIFARIRLTPDEFTQYQRHSREVDSLIQPPDVLVHLDACLETLLARIAGRGRTFERTMDRPFLQTMRQAYADYLGSSLPGHCPIIGIDCDREDFRREHVLADLTGTIQGLLG